MTDDPAADATDGPTDVEVARTAAEAAEGVVLDRYRTSAVRDLDVTVAFDDGVLEVDVYVDPPAEAEADAEAVVEDAVRAAEAAVDDLLG